MSDKSRSTAFLLCYFLGLLGAHRFYLRRRLSGLLMLLTLGGLTIWWMVDAVLIAAGQLRDADGRPLRTGPPDPEQPYAGFWVRFAAISVDVIVLNLILSVLLTGASLALPLIGIAVLGSTDAVQAMDERQAMILGAWMAAAAGVASLAALPIYFGIQHASRHQATIGKRCFELRVVAADGARVGLGRAAWRGLAYVLSALPLYLGFVMAAFTRDKRALHDVLAGTRVCYAQAAPQAQAPPLQQPAPPVAAPPALPAREEAAAGGRSGAALLVLGVLLLAGAAAMALL